VDKPFAESCVRNQSAILGAIRPYLTASEMEVLEIGSGTGQHAVHIASALANVVWQPSDLRPSLSGIQAWVEGASLGNLYQPLLLDVNDCPRFLASDKRYDAVFTANTIHYVSKETSSSLISVAANMLKPQGLLFVYGAFNQAGSYTSDGNRRLDEWLRSRDPMSGLKDVSWLEQAARLEGFELIEQLQMPANNLLFVFCKKETRTAR